MVIVTGGASGIGLHMVKDFLAEGCHVAMADVNEETLANESEQLFKVTGKDRLITLCCDITDPAQANDLINQVVGHWGHLNILVNNAGVCVGGRFIEQDPVAVKKMIDVNLAAPLHLTQLAVPHMVKAGYGHVVNIYSSSATLGIPGYAGYAAAKAGLFAFTRMMRREMAGSGVNFTVLCPGYTMTPMTAAAIHAGSAAVRSHHGPEVPAAAAIEAIKHNRKHVVVSDNPVSQAIIAFLDRLFPSLFDRMWIKMADDAYYEGAARAGKPVGD